MHQGAMNGAPTYALGLDFGPVNNQNGHGST